MTKREMPSMTYRADKHHRRSIRLAGYDYSQSGAYFITLCMQNRECRFGEIINGSVRLNDAGNIACQCWKDIPAHFPCVVCDVFVIMPNHVHGILFIEDSVGADDVRAKNISPLPPLSLPLPPLPHGTSKTIGSIVRGFKIGVTKWMRQSTPVQNIWQRNYYEHIIRNDEELNRIRQYILENPARWEIDRENPNTKNATMVRRGSLRTAAPFSGFENLNTKTVKLAATIKKNFEELGI